MKMLKNDRFYYYFSKLLRGYRGESRLFAIWIGGGSVERLIRGEDLGGVKEDLHEENEEMKEEKMKCGFCPQA